MHAKSIRQKNTKKEKKKKSNIYGKEKNSKNIMEETVGGEINRIMNDNKREKKQTSGN